MSSNHIPPAGVGASSVPSLGVPSTRTPRSVQQAAADRLSSPSGSASETAWVDRAVSVACDPYPRINEIYAVKRQDPVGKLAQQIEKLKEEV